ncbi:MAG: DUF4349 domain-containing protein [Oscillospiraceae bacterium]|nr:DUF4349 domain-containing protein [Oscillospiraceae bacterium]
MKKKLFVLSSIICLILSFAACGGASADTANAAAAESPEEEILYMDEAEEYDDAVYTEAATEAVEAPAAASGSTSVASGEQRADAKLIYTGNLNVEATDFHKAVQELSDLVSSYGGYFENSEAYANSYENYANYTIRVSSEHFHEFMNAVSDNSNCKVTYQNTSVEDVGQIYYDLESHLEMLNGKLERLNQLWEQAENMEDIISLESAISELEYEISSYSSQKNRYDSLINYSTIYLTITEVQVYSEPVEPTFGEKLSHRFQSGIQSFKSGCEDLLLFFIGNLIQIIVFFVICGGIVLMIVRAVRRRRRKAHQETTLEDNV